MCPALWHLWHLSSFSLQTLKHDLTQLPNDCTGSASSDTLISLKMLPAMLSADLWYNSAAGASTIGGLLASFDDNTDAGPFGLAHNYSQTDKQMDLVEPKTSTTCERPASYILLFEHLASAFSSLTGAQMPCRFGRDTSVVPPHAAFHSVRHGNCVAVDQFASFSLFDSGNGLIGGLAATNVKGASPNFTSATPASHAFPAFQSSVGTGDCAGTPSYVAHATCAMKL